MRTGSAVNPGMEQGTQTAKSIKGTPFRTPLRCDAQRHALKRDSKKTPFLRWKRRTDERGRFLGVTAQCRACEAGARPEPDSPLVLSLITGMDDLTQ